MAPYANFKTVSSHTSLRIMTSQPHRQPSSLACSFPALIFQFSFLDHFLRRWFLFPFDSHKINNFVDYITLAPCEVIGLIEGSIWIVIVCGEDDDTCPFLRWTTPVICDWLVPVISAVRLESDFRTCRDDTASPHGSVVVKPRATIGPVPRGACRVVLASNPGLTRRVSA